VSLLRSRTTQAQKAFGGEAKDVLRWTFLVKFDGEFAPGSQTYAGSGTLRYVW